MIRYRAVMHLDGAYKREFPEPVAFSTRDGPKWMLTKAGPRYLNVYEVIEFDDVGRRWLEANERRDVPAPAPPPARDPTPPRRTEKPAPLLSGKALEEWRRGLIARGTAGIQRGR